MVLPSADECDECVPEYLQASGSATIRLLLSTTPFLLTFLAVAFVSWRTLFPFLCPLETAGIGAGSKDHGHASSTRRGDHTQSRGGERKEWRQLVTRRHVSALVFSTTISLAAVLAELILCEISETLSRRARNASIALALPALVTLLIVATPMLELHVIITGAGWQFSGGRAAKVAWLLEVVGMSVWLAAFFYLGRGFLGTYLHEESYIRKHSVMEGCLERIGVVGVTLMGSLAGFAAVSSLWQTFGIRKGKISETDIARKQMGLDSTTSMLATKRSRLRALELKVGDTPREGFMTRMMGSIRGNADDAELQTLHMEVAGLETMQDSLSSSLSTLQSRRKEQLRAHTVPGRIQIVLYQAFAVYCAYRILATGITLVRRRRLGVATFSDSDPINNVLALMVRHWDPSLNRQAWSRLFSFFLSGAMLLASFNAVVQTFTVIVRLFPGLFRHTRGILALLVSQVAATYVISSTLLLRSNLPGDVRSVVSNALGAPLEPRFVDRWFEGWFLASSLFTAVAIWLSRKINGDGWDDDTENTEPDVELGKMC